MTRAFNDFPRTFRGSIHRPDDPGYSEARAIYNARTNQAMPALIARAADDQDVRTVARYAHETGTPLAVRAGGHGVDGTAMPHDALVCDLSSLKSISIDRTSGIVHLGAGVLLGEMDRALEQYGLVVPAGTVSTTGIAGLTLGGGVGYHMRAYGATVDNLLACDVVTVDGRMVRADRNHHPDLFWALRGGGGNLGVVTGFTFQARPVEREVAAGVIAFPHAQAAEVLTALGDHMRTAPRQLAVIAALTQCPPLPPVPLTYHGTPALILVVVYTGPPSQAQPNIDRLTALGRPFTTAVAASRWSDANSLLDAIAPAGRRTYTKGGYLPDLDPQVVDIISRYTAAAPRPTSAPLPSTVCNVWAMGGAISEDFDEDSAAFSRSGARWLWEAVAQVDHPDQDAVFREWVDAFHADLKPSLLTNGYANLSTDQGLDWRRGLWGSPDKYARLTEAKATWDPHNLLRFNANIAPPTVADRRTSPR